VDVAFLNVAPGGRRWCRC